MGRIICCGLGPAAPDMMSVRADRTVRGAKHVAYFRKKGRPGQARRIVEGMLAADVAEYPMEYPVTTEIAFDSAEYIQLLAGFYDEWAERLARLSGAVDVVVLLGGLGARQPAGLRAAFAAFKANPGLGRWQDFEAYRK